MNLSIKPIIFVLLVTLPIAVLSVSFAQEPLRKTKSNATSQQSRIQIELFDGTRVVGSPNHIELKFDLGFDEITIPFENMRKAEWKTKLNRFSIELKNRDRFSGTLLTEEIGMRAIFGDVVLKSRNMTSVTVLGDRLRYRMPDTEGLVAFFDFDNVANSRVLNRIGERHPINLGTARIKNRDGEGGSLSFSGAEWIQIPHHEELCQPKMTISAWMKPTGTASQRNGYSFILGKTNDGGSWSKGYGFVSMSGDPEHIHFYINGYTSSVTKVKVPSGKWAHLTGVCDSKTVKLFLNGRQVQSIKIPSRKLEHSTKQLMIGGDSGGYRWRGELDDIAIYKRALNADEVQRLFEDFERPEGHSVVVDDPFGH